MAQKISDRNSTDYILTAVRRQIRLSKQVSGAEKFGTQLVPFRNKLAEKLNATQQSTELRQNAYDDILRSDRILDNTIRNVYGRTREYERDHIGEAITMKIFPNGTFSEIVNLPYAKEPAEADNIAIRIESLGDGHPLFPLAAELRTKSELVRSAITVMADAIRHEKMVQAEEDIAKLEMCRAYEYCIYDAKKELGADGAELIFPALYKPVRKEEEVPQTLS